MTPDGHCENLEELLAYIQQYADEIFIRGEPHLGADGEMTRNWRLSELPAKQALLFMSQCILRGMTPVRVRTEDRPQ